MANATGYFTYRFSNLPKGLDLVGDSGLIDRERITRVSVAPCPISPETFDVATVTFHGLPSFSQQLRDGEGMFESPTGEIRVDNTFLGITPLNHPENAEVE